MWTLFPDSLSSVWLDKDDLGQDGPVLPGPLSWIHCNKKEDRGLFGTRRTEGRSRHADSHLGDVFWDWLLPTGLRYGMNFSALRLQFPKRNWKRYGLRRVFEAFRGKIEVSH